MANDIVQTIAEARVDARSLSEFVFKPAGFKVTRRLAPPIDTLQFYIDRFDATVTTIPSIVNDAINNTAVEGGVLADTFVTVTTNGTGTVARTQRDKNSDMASVKDFGAKGDAVTDDKSSVQAAIWKIRDNDDKRTLYGGNQNYAISSGVFLGKGDVHIDGVNLTPTEPFEGEELLQTNTGLRQHLSNARFRLAGVANGIHNASNGFLNSYNNIEIDDFKDYGIRLEGSGDQHLHHVAVSQKGEVSKRTGNGVEVLTGDIKLEFCTFRYANKPLVVNGNTLLATGNHFYNGSANSSTPATNSINIEIQGGYGSSFAHTYLDKGSVILRDRASAAFFDTKLLFNSQPEHNAVFILDAGDTSNKKFDNLVYDGSTSTVPLDNKSMQFVRLIGTGSGGWSDSAGSIRDEINLRHGGYPRIVPKETVLYRADTMSHIVAGDTSRTIHALGSLGYSGNTSSAVNEIYKASEMSFEAAGMTQKIKGTGQFSSASVVISGSRSGVDSETGSLFFENRQGEANSTPETSSGWGLSLLSLQGGALGSLVLTAKSVNNAPSEQYRFRTSGITPSGSKDLGSSAAKWQNIHLVNAPTVGSDASLKTDVKDVSELESRAARLIKKEIKRYRLKDVDNKLRFGVVAQDVVSILNEVGLDPDEYSFIHKDNNTGLYAIRYEELAMFILASI